MSSKDWPVSSTISWQRTLPKTKYHQPSFLPLSLLHTFFLFATQIMLSFVFKLRIIYIPTSIIGQTYPPFLLPQFHPIPYFSALPLLASCASFVLFKKWVCFLMPTCARAWVWSHLLGHGLSDVADSPSPAINCQTLLSSIWDFVTLSPVHDGIWPGLILHMTCACNPCPSFERQHFGLKKKKKLRSEVMPCCAHVKAVLLELYVVTVLQTTSNKIKG